VKKAQIIYVLPYEFYFTGLNNEIGGHTSHIIGVVEALIQRGYQIKIISDMPVPGLDDRAIEYYTPAFQSLRRMLRSLEQSSKIPNPQNKSFITIYAKICIRPITKFLVRRLNYLLFCSGLFLTIMLHSKRSGVSFIYYRHNLNGFIPAIASKIMRIPLVVEVNTPSSISTFYYGKEIKNNKKIRIHIREKIQYELARVISVVSPLVRDWITHNAGSKYAEKILLNTNGVNLNRFNVQLKSTNDIRLRYGIDSNETLVGMVAVFIEYNAIEELIESFQRARNRIGNLRLILMGESHLRKDLETYTKTLHLSETVIFTGRIPFERMSSYLASCDILVSHFNYGNILPYGCSIKHLEYMSMARPVIATDVGYVNFAIRHKQNGLLVPQGDIDGFARAIIKLASDPDLRKKLGEQGRIDAESSHSWGANVDRILRHLN
jgi:glycosyltransferase involved in cell wall biosynthesis